MKTKLLRKVRKRYSIVYYPNGFKTHMDTIYSECVVLNDSKCSFNARMTVFQMTRFTKEEAFSILRIKLIKWIRNDYDHLGIRKNKLRKIKEKLWYNDGKGN